ncbi:MAG: diguanylate cyclase [Lachnospiraceae bacterium]
MDKVLIVDDSRLDVVVLADILKAEYDVITANSGEEGLEKAKAEDPVLILLDIIMPVMDGFEVLRRLKADTATMNIPVIFLTALSDEKIEEEGFMKGAIDYVKKPFNPHIVRARVRNHVKLYLYMRTIETQMSIDGLTGAYNRRAFDKQKYHLGEMAAKESKLLSVFILDIDYFKKVNDTYGHGEGDFVLKNVVNKIQEVVSKEPAFLARYGGEEFAVLLYGKTADEAVEIAEQIRNAVYELQIPNTNSDVCPYLTVSIGGLTCMPEGNNTVDEMIEIADIMLYQAKNNGRNQTCWKK